MKTRFTPGPWDSIKGGVATNEDKHCVRSADGTWIAETVPHQPKGCSQEANASLISAAPDGYDFASRFEAAVGFMVAGLPANHAVAKDLLGLRDVARAYLAKARGESGVGR